MIKYIIKRILLAIPVMIGVITLAFALNLITPGDPVEMILGVDATDEMKENMREDLGLNDPTLVRYGKYIWNFFTKLDMGTSYISRNPVKDEIMERYPVTIRLAFSAVGLAAILGISIGVISAVRQYSIVDNLTMTFSMVFVSMPNFWFSLMLMLLFAVKLNLVPASGISSPLGWILPTLTIALGCSANIARTTRSSMLEVIRQDYVDTARAKGLSERKVVMRHCIRNASIPIVTQIGGQIGFQLGGALAIELVYSVPGLGSYIVQAIQQRNYAAVQGSVVFLALIFTIVNLAIDIAYTFIDPRLKESFKRQGAVKKSKKMMKKMLEAEAEAMKRGA